MKNLLELAKKATSENVKVRKSSTISTNQQVLELILEHKALDRTTLTYLLAYKRVMNKLSISEVELQKQLAAKDKNLQEALDKAFITSKNALDQTVSNAQNNSSFNNNSEFNTKYKLTKINNIINIVKL